jgi:hypothetical protein
MTGAMKGRLQVLPKPVVASEDDEERMKRKGTLGNHIFIVSLL